MTNGSLPAVIPPGANLPVPVVKRAPADTPGKGQVVLVTGASSGIGRCVAEGLHKRGYRVFATVRKPADETHLQQQGIETLCFDLADSSAIYDAVEQLLIATGGKLYGLFNNAAYGLAGAVEDLPRDALRAQFEINVLGLHDLTCRVLPAMRRAGAGRIIMNSSVLGRVAVPLMGGYVASKYALEGLTDTLRLELRGSGIHTVLIEPGPIRSRFRSTALSVFEQQVDTRNSPHHERYRDATRRLQQPGDPMPFTLGPEAVLDKVILALEKKRPRARYPVTLPAHLMAGFSRLLPTRLLDRILSLR